MKFITLNTKDLRHQVAKIKKCIKNQSFHVSSSLGNPDHLQVVSDPNGKNYTAGGGQQFIEFTP